MNSKAMVHKLIFSVFLAVLCINQGHAQSKQLVSGYPKPVGYFAVIHPIITFDKNGHTTNFDGSYTVGFPTGIHVLKSDRFGYSLEVVPFIKAQNGTSKVYNVLFHPGLLFKFSGNWILYTRAAFETSGRYGFTPALSKVVYKTKSNNFFVTVPVPFRFGNNQPASFGCGLQLGLTL